MRPESLELLRSMLQALECDRRRSKDATLSFDFGSELDDAIAALNAACESHAVALMHDFAMRAPAQRWDFALEDPELVPDGEVIGDEEYAQLIATAQSEGNPKPIIERVRNLAEVDAVMRRNAIRKAAAWPWVWARAVLAEMPFRDELDGGDS